MDWIGLLTGQLHSPDILQQLGRSAGVSPEQAGKLADIGLPMLFEQISRNASTPKGQDSLFKALDQHQGDSLDDLAGFLKGVDTQDGAKILKHVFSDKNEGVQNSLAETSGLSSQQVMTLLSLLAPLVLGALGRQKKSQGVKADGLSGLASSLSQSLGLDKSLAGVLGGLLDGEGGSGLLGDLFSKLIK